jgi:hypothetical protein
MDYNHVLCLYVSYYLSRFNRVAYDALGYGNMNETHLKIGEALKTNPHTVKNMRDQFDPLHGFRAGWHQEPLSPSRARVAMALQDLDEPQIREIVIEILSGGFNDHPGLLASLTMIAKDSSSETGSAKFILRTPTGRSAEEFFLRNYAETRNPVHGKLTDCRDFGVGYDFKIENETGEFYVEVKGLSEFSGGLLFTSKEWEIAKKERARYFLCVVSNLSRDAKIKFIQNPAQLLNPIKHIYTAIQTSWNVPESQLDAIDR